MILLDYGELDTPLGPLALAHRDGVLCASAFGEAPDALLARLAQRFPGARPSPAPTPPSIERALSAYFRGALDALSALPLDPGGTPFQARVWSALRGLPAGRTTSYGALARSLGAPGASRAVGAANASNPLALFIPCHRVIAEDGALRGYAWGVERKRWLLQHEGALAAASRVA